MYKRQGSFLNITAHPLHGTSLDNGRVFLVEFDDYLTSSDIHLAHKIFCLGVHGRDAGILYVFQYMKSCV